MATNIELNTKIDTANAAASMGELRRSLRDLIALQGQVGAGSAEFARLGEAINTAEGRIGDLNDSFQTLRGSGVERLNGSLGLLRQGFANADPTQIGTAFRGLGSAMSAVPIFLIIEGFKLLIENFDKVIGFVKTLTGGFSDEERELTKLNKTIEDQKKANIVLIASLENNITLLEASGKSEREIIAAKKELTAVKIKEAENDVELQKLKIKDVLLNDSIWESTLRISQAIQRKLGNDKVADQLEVAIQQNKKERLVEFQDALRNDLITINKLKTDQLAEEIKLEVKQNTDLKKVSEDRNKDKIKAAEDFKNTFNKTLDDDIAQEEKAQAERDKAFKDRTDAEQKEFERVEKFKSDALAKEIADRDALLKAQAERELALKKATTDAEFQIGKSGIQSLQGLSDLAFSIKQANTKRGASEEEKAARQQFKINKALQISSATITGIQGVLQALTAKSILPEPLATGLRITNAAAVGLTTAASIAKIAATQFQSAGGGGGSISAPSTSGGGSSSGTGEGASIPKQNITPLNFNQNTVGKIGGPGGSNTPGNQTVVQNSYVAVTEFEKVANKVKTTESQAQFG